MIRTVTGLVGGAVIIVSILLLAGCQDDVAVSKPLGLEGKYAGNYSFLSIAEGTDTTAEIRYKVKVTFDRSIFVMNPADTSARAIFCEILGEYLQESEVLTVHNVNGSSGYTRGVCDESFGPGGDFQYRLDDASLNMIADVSVAVPEGRTVRTIKKLELRRQ